MFNQDPQAVKLHLQCRYRSLKRAPRHWRLITEPAIMRERDSLDDPPIGFKFSYKSELFVVDEKKMGFCIRWNHIIDTVEVSCKNMSGGEDWIMPEKDMISGVKWGNLVVDDLFQ